MSTWHGVMADEEKFMRWKTSTNTVYNTFKTDTKYSHSVRGRSTELSNVNREKNKLKSFPLTVYISNNLASPVYQDKKNSYKINP